MKADNAQNKRFILRKADVKRLLLLFTVFILSVCVFISLAACNKTDDKNNSPSVNDSETSPSDDPSLEEQPPSEEDPDAGESDAPTLKQFDAVEFADCSVVYDGLPHVIEPTGEVPFGTTIKYSRNDIVNAGEYELSATLSLVGYETRTFTATLTILPAPVDLLFEDKTFVWDGAPHSIFISGRLPEDSVVTYDGNEQTEVGSYSVVAHVEINNDNYLPVSDLTATLTIVNRVYIVQFVHWDGSVEERTVERGCDLPADSIPENKDKEGYDGMFWDPDELAELKEVYEDKVVHERAGSLKIYTAILDTGGYPLSFSDHTYMRDDGKYVLHYTAEDEITLIAPFRYDGAPFDGWYDEHGKRVTRLPDGELRDMTLTAVWAVPDEQSAIGTNDITFIENAANTFQKRCNAKFVCDNILCLDGAFDYDSAFSVASSQFLGCVSSAARRSARSMSTKY